MEHYTRNTVSVSAAPFALEQTGPQVPCDFPGCTLDAFHDGEHLMAKPPAEFPKGGYHFICIICKTPMVAYGERKMYTANLCDSEECLRAWCLISGPNKFLVMCGCPQRPYAHELSIHAEIKREAYNPAVRYSWPWSLTLSTRIEPSTEKNA